jgi:hypothetical protein
MALFGPTDKELKATAKKEYDKAVSLKGDSRKEDAYRMRIALRARGHIDKLFVEAAQKAEKFNDIAMMCIAEGKPAPEPPKPSNFMKLVTASGEVWSYLPEEYASIVFKYGMLYQGMNVSGPKAIAQVQKMSDAIGIELRLETPLIALEFLRVQLEEEGVDVEAEIAALEPDDGDDLDEV